MSQMLRQATLVAVIASVVMFTNLGGPRLWDRDEPRNAECAVEMLERGDWVTPVMNGELRTHKPVLLYWLMMSAYGAFGVDEFSARFWSAVLAVGTTLCTYAMGRRLFDGRVGTWSGVIVATVLMFDVAGRAATPDSPLIFLTTLAITLFVLGTFPPQDEADLSRYESARLFPSWPWAAAMYLVMGLAMLAKGPVGLVLPTAVIGMFLLIMRLPVSAVEPTSRTWFYKLKRAASCFAPLHFLKTCWLMRPVTAIAISFAVALPWYIWVGVRTDGEFLRGFFFEHNLSRATQSMEGHSGSILFYPAAMLAGFFPWSVFAVPVVLDAVRHSRQNSRWVTGYIFAACWVGVYVGAFSLAKTKLPSYVTPCYPALALITGCFIERWTRNVLTTSGHWFRGALGITSLVGLGFVIGVPIMAHYFLPGDEWLGAIGVIPLAAGVITLYFAEKNQPRRAAYVFASSAFLFATLLFGGVIGRVDRHQQSDVLLREIASHGDDVQVASFGLIEPSWVFYYKQPIDELAGQDTRTGGRTWIERSGTWVKKPLLSVDDLLSRSSEPLIITSDHHLPQLQDRLPEGYGVISDIPYFMRNGRILLVGPISRSDIARKSPPGTPTTQR
jgi:4-amino-4-deoxy-L-arabinose transferase-like glycosyltransferase